MSRVEQLEGQVKNLNPDELKEFRDWFAKFDGEVWDQQIEADSKGSKLRKLAKRALKDHQSGKSTPL